MLNFTRLGHQTPSTYTPAKPYEAPIVQDEDGQLYISLGSFQDLKDSAVQKRRKVKEGSKTPGTPYEGVDLIEVEGVVEDTYDVPSNATDPASVALLSAAAADGVIPRDGEELRATVKLKLHLPRSTGWLGIDPVGASWAVVQPVADKTPAKAPRKVRRAGKGK